MKNKFNNLVAEVSKDLRHELNMEIMENAIEANVLYESLSTLNKEQKLIRIKQSMAFIDIAWNGLNIYKQYFGMNDFYFERKIALLELQDSLKAEEKLLS